MIARPFRLVFILTAASLAFAAPARADRCDDLAKQLAEQISGLKVGATRGGEIALTHPAVTQASLGCSSKNATNSMSAATDKNGLAQVACVFALDDPGKVARLEWGSHGCSSNFGDGPNGRAGRKVHSRAAAASDVANFNVAGHPAR